MAGLSFFVAVPSAAAEEPPQQSNNCNNYGVQVTFSVTGNANNNNCTFQYCAGGAGAGTLGFQGQVNTAGSEGQQVQDSKATAGTGCTQTSGGGGCSGNSSSNPACDSRNADGSSHWNTPADEFREQLLG